MNVNSVCEQMAKSPLGDTMGGKGEYQFSSVTRAGPTLCDLMGCSTPGLPVHHQLMSIEFVGDAIQPSHPLSSPSPPTFSLSQHQGLFQ